MARPILSASASIDMTLKMDNIRAELYEETRSVQLTCKMLHTSLVESLECCNRKIKEIEKAQEQMDDARFLKLDEFLKRVHKYVIHSTTQLFDETKTSLATSLSERDEKIASLESELRKKVQQHDLAVDRLEKIVDQKQVEIEKLQKNHQSLQQEMKKMSMQITQVFEAIINNNNEFKKPGKTVNKDVLQKFTTPAHNTS